MNFLRRYRLASAIRVLGLFLLLAWGLGGCSSLSQVEHLYATGSQKENLLAERLDRFTRALYWGSLEEASGYVDSSVRNKFYQDARARSESEKLVEIKVRNVQIDQDNSNQADVELKVRYYQQPTYIVRTRTENLEWKYSRFAGGWFLHGIEVTEVEEKAKMPTRKPPNRGSMRRW